VSPAALGQIAARLESANRPAIIARPSAARGAAGQALAALASRLGIPPIVTGAPRGLSDLKYAEAIRALPEADVVIVVAPADFAAGFLGRDLLPGDVLLIDAPGDPEPSRTPDLRLQAAPSDALPMLADMVASSSADPAWRERLARRDPLPEAPDDADALHPLAVAAAVREVLRPEDTLVLDGGEFCQWLRLGLRDVPNRMLWNGKLGAIGGALPQGLGVAASEAPGRVIIFQGDGGAGYHLSEFETVAREKLDVTVIVGNDARWSAEWHQQVSRYGPDRTFDTALLPARYDQAAGGFASAGEGVFSADVTDVETFRDALEQALAAGRPACLNVHVRSLASPAVVHG
jgi:acetolactate synthase-1/2/3 large subunit